jgi:hypothetical protein
VYLNAAVIKKGVLFHQPIDFFMVNNPVSFCKFLPHQRIPITAELLLQDHFNLLYHHVVFSAAALPSIGVGAGFSSFVSLSALVISAGRQFGPR